MGSSYVSVGDGGTDAAISTALQARRPTVARSSKSKSTHSRDPHLQRVPDRLGGVLDPRPGLCVPQDLRYKGKGHELSSLYPSRPEPRLHLLSVVRPEVRYERVGAAEVPCE